MEQAQYWMWKKRRQILRSDLHVWRSLTNDSWEEKAFAKDASGHHGGCIWPPRSYSCSFCKREFRSAQALGGHMNVHRRDRARLKQPDPCPPDEIDDICDDVVHPNSSSGSRVSGFSVQEIRDGSEQGEILVKNSREEIYGDLVETDLLMGLNAGHDNYSIKRAKKTGVSGFSLLIKKPCLSDRYSFKAVSSHEAVSNSSKDIDLELRLG